MSDFGSPVASPKPVGAGLSMLSDLMNVKRSQQALQTGVYQQQTAAAQAQQEQQTASQRQTAARFFQNYDTASHVGPDGTIDLDQALTNPQLKATGDAYPVIAKSLIDMKNSQLDAKQKLATLDAGVRQNFFQNVGGLSSDPDVKQGNNQGAGKVLDAIDQFGQSGGPDAARVAAVYKPVIQSLLAAGKASKLPEVLSNFQLQALDAGKQREQTYGTPTSIDNGATVQPGVQAPAAAGGGFTPSGAAIAKAPESVRGTGDQILNRNRQTGALSLPPVAGAPAGSGGASPAPLGKLPAMQRPGINAPAADQANYNARVQQLGQEYQAVSTAANDPMNGVQSTRFRNQQILDLVPHATTGPGMRMLNVVASRLPGSTGDAFQDLEHYLSQNSASMAKTMGVPSTNLGAETAAAAAGNVERNPGALREITRTNDALNTAMDLYNRGFAKVTNNGSDMSRAAAYKQAFGQNLDINAIRWIDAHRRKDQEEIADLTRKLGPNGITAVQQKLRVLQSLGANGDLP